MASTITSAGAASGMDFESIISASVESKRASLTSSVTEQKENANIEISGVATLKSALETFQNAIEDLTKEESFNARKVTIENSDIFSITTNDDAANMNMNIAVTQLADSEKIKKTIDTSDDSFKNSFEAGTITITLGPDPNSDEEVDVSTLTDEEKAQYNRSFTIEVAEGDTIETIRKKINNNNYGVSFSLIQGEEGYSFTIDSGKTGVNGSNLTIETTPASTDASSGKDSLSIFNFNNDEADSNGTTDNNGFTYAQGKDAKINVDGLTISSNTNTFEEKISGLTITVNKLSEKADEDDTSVVEGPDGTKYKTYTANVTQDVDTVASKVDTFVSAYNTLMSTLETLYAHNTYTDGENNYDGGNLAGDASVRAIETQLQSMVSSFSTTSNGISIFDMGISFESDGTLKFEKDDFTEAMEDNYNSVVTLFSDEENGLFNKLNTYVEDYTKTNGILDERTEQLNMTVSDLEDKENANEEYLEEYEASLRQKYANLDTLIAGYNTSMNTLTSMLSSLSYY